MLFTHSKYIRLSAVADRSAPLCGTPFIWCTPRGASSVPTSDSCYEYSECGYILDYYWDQMANAGCRTYYIRTMTCFDNPWSKMTLHKFFGFVQKCLDNIFQNWGFWCANAALQVELCRLAVQPETLQEPAKGRWNKRGWGSPSPRIPPCFNRNRSKTFSFKRSWILTNPPSPQIFRPSYRPIKRGENMTSFHECPAKVQ